MNTEDHAILIGIGHYPEFGDNRSPLHLQGPHNDVDSIRAWLVDPHGGGFPPDTKKIHVVKATAADTAADARPTMSELDKLIGDLDDLATERKNNHQLPLIGRRIYIYMSGHGFSPGRQRACLFTSDAKERLTSNVHATGWINWLQDSGYFREFVLWFDACMNRASFIPPHDPPLPIPTGPNPPLANFVALAAQRPLKAVELPIIQDGGKTHGVFTWTLLEGLRGAAADINGRVTGRSLADWLRNAQSARYDPRDRGDRDVAQEPEVVQEDAGLIFARGVVPPVYEVSLSFPPDAKGKQAQLWAGTPPVVVQSFRVEDTSQQFSLRPSLYLVEVADANLRHGFEVVCPVSVVVEDTGTVVTPSKGDELFQFNVASADPTAEIFIIDSRFSLVDYGLGTLSTPLPPGVFKVKVRIGNAINQRVVLLDQDTHFVDNAVAPQLLATTVPLPQTAATHEFHEEARRLAMDTASMLAPAPGQAVIMAMVRTFSSKDNPVGGVTPPWKGVSVVDAMGRMVFDMEANGERNEGPDAFAFFSIIVEPGSYFLRQRLEGGVAIEQSVIACTGWRTEVYVLRRVVPGTSMVDLRPRISLMMRRPDIRLSDAVNKEDRLVETAKQAMATERRILSRGVDEELMLKAENPVAGIIGGHLLLIERERDAGRDLSMLDTVVTNLRALLGKGHPDVEALALKCADPKLRRVGALTGPPMFQLSWTLLVQGAQKRADLIQSDMWARVHAQAALPPFLIWNTNEDVKAAVRAEIARAVFGNDATDLKVDTPPPLAVTMQPMAAGAMMPAGLAEAMMGAAANFASSDSSDGVSVDAFPGEFAPTHPTRGSSKPTLRASMLTRAARAKAVTMNIPPCALQSMQSGI